MNAKKREEKLQEDEALLKSLGKYIVIVTVTCTDNIENFNVEILYLVQP